ncbi:MAG: tail fiber domain-containing protein [Bacteroidia bacterium]|nr:tail fiber domain-containing protein [Bacteroidia bacterium]
MSKKIYVSFSLFLLSCIYSLAQNIGIGTAAPNTKLEIMGDLSLRTANLPLSNGANHNISTNIQKFSHYRITGPVAPYSITGINGGTDGRILILSNTTPQVLTLSNLSVASLSPNQIITGNGGNLLIGANGSVMLVYNTTDSKWRVNSYNSGIQGAWNLTGNSGTNSSVNFLGTTDNQNLVFKTNNTTQMIVTTQGRIGINPVTPLGLYYPYHRIEIQDSNGLNSDIVIRTASAGGFNGVPAWVSMKSNGTLQTPAIVNWGDYLGESYYYGYDGSNFRIGAILDVNIDTMPGLNSMPSRFSFLTAQSGGIFPQERFRIRHNGEIWFGNLNSALTTEEGGSIELGGRNLYPGYGEPHIDFHWDSLAEDYNVRLVNSGNKKLEVAFSGGTGTMVVNGSVTANCGTLICSDARYKTNITPIGNALSSLQQINGYYYNWNSPAFPDKGFTPDRQIGVIAQEMEKIYPELVLTDEKGYKSVDYARITPILIEAIKAQQEQITKQDQKIKEMEAGIENLKAQMNSR